VTVANANSREHLLEAYGRFYGQERFAVTFTATIEGDDAKRVTTKQWDQTKPLATADYAAGLISQRGQTRNVAIVLRPSNLVVLECDTEDDLLRIQELNLPVTLTVRSSKPYKRHFYFRPPADIEQLPYVAFRFESGKLTADTGRYFLAPPSIHPSGAIYSFLPDLGPEDVDIAELDSDLYRRLAAQAREETAEQRERIHVDPNAKVHAGQRGDSVFRYACMLRRWGLGYDEILAAAHAWNDARCEPPIERSRVEMQVDGAMKKRGDQELERALANPLDDGPEPHVEIDSWEPVNLAQLGDKPPVQPTLGNVGIVYPGKRHVFSGPQESAKTLAAYAIGLEVIRAGGTIVVIDFEMGRWDARDRLIDLGATPDELERVVYVDPSEPATPERIQRLVDAQPELVIIDAAAGAYDIQGLDDNKRADVEKFTRIYVRDFWRAGIATIVLDHVVKNAETRGNYAIGSERKVGGADVHLGFTVVAPIRRGTTGIYKIVTHKDRGGYLQRGRLADLHLASDPVTHRIGWEFREAEHTAADEPFRPTGLMGHVSIYLQRQDEPVSFSTVKADVKGEDKYIAVALERLIQEGYASETRGPRGARLVTHIALFTDQDPPLRASAHAESSPSDDESAPNSPNPPLRTPASPLRADLPSTPARASIGAGVEGVETPTTADAGVDVYDPAIQSLLDDDIPF